MAYLVFILNKKHLIVLIMTNRPQRVTEKVPVVNMLDCDIVASEFELQARYVHFLTWKGINPIFLELLVKYNHYSYSTTMPLSLNFTQRLICH